MPEAEVVVPGTPPESGDAAPPAVPTGENPATTAAPADAASDPALAPAPKKPDPRQKKIAELAYQNREQQRQIDRLLGLVERTTTAPRNQTADNPPKIEDFRTIDEFLDARDQYRDKLREQKAPNTDKGADPQQQRYQEAVKAATDDLFSAGAEKYEDFEEVVRDDSVKITPAMRDAIFELDDLDTQTELAYYLGKNPKEALRISRLSPIRQVSAIGKLEATLSTKPAPVKRPSAAPAPINPVSGAETKSTKITVKDSVAEHIKKRRAGVKFGQ